PDDPCRGLLYEGRITEDFKLSSGTWVNVDRLRGKLLEQFAPLVRDIVLTGSDRDEIAALLFPDLDACRCLIPQVPVHAPAADVLRYRRVRLEFKRLLNAHAKESTGGSTR